MGKTFNKQKGGELGPRGKTGTVLVCSAEIGVIEAAMEPRRLRKREA